MRTREGCVWGMVPVLRGRKFRWPCISLEVTSGLLELYRPQHGFRPGMLHFRWLFSFLAPKTTQWNPALCFSHLQQHCRSHLLSEITRSLFSPCFSRYQIPLTQNVHPNSLSSPLRYVYESSLFPCTARAEPVRWQVSSCWPAAVVWLWWQVTLSTYKGLAVYGRNSGAMCSCHSHLCYT